MSIEKLIQENTAALVALTAAISAQTSVKNEPPVPGHADPAVIASAKAAIAKNAAKLPVAEKPASEEAKPLKYEDVSKPVADFVRDVGRDAALLVLKPFGVVKGLNDTKPEQWPAILVAVAEAHAKFKAEKAVA